MKLVAFELVDIRKVELPIKCTKEERAPQHTEDIVSSTKIAEAIQLTWCETETPGNVISGSATKTSETRWTVFLSNRNSFEVDEKELLDANKK